VHVSSPSVAHAGTALTGAGAGPADPGRARGHYSRTKAVAEIDALAADSASLAVLVLRPHLVWGPGDTQLVGPIVERARSGRLATVGSGAALIDTTYVDNAAAALIAAVDACGPVHGEALVVSNGEPRPVGEIIDRLCRAARVPGPRRRVPFGAAWLAGAALEAVWAVTGRRSTPPLTRFLAEQLATAHWFDQRRTRAALGWAPQVGLDEGFARVAAWYAGQSSRSVPGRGGAGR
jgi:nucleoside-diphosphate-sugar epimerase